MELFFQTTLETTFNEPKQGMTCDKAGNIYLGGEEISVWGNGMGPPDDLGPLPPAMYTRGDLTFRNGKLYLSSVSNTLVEVDLDDPMNSTVVMSFPPGTPEIHGLATINIGCDSVETYAVGSHILEGSTLYRIDFDNWTLEEICQYEHFITGLAAYDECILPDCLVNIDLDGDDSSTAPGNDFQAGIVCAFPVSISDSDLAFISDLPDIDSVSVELLDFLSPLEYLDLSQSGNVDVTGAGINSLMLFNNGTSTLLDFEQAIGSVLYHNDETDPPFGEREIRIIAYSGPYQSAVATAYLTIGEPVIAAGFTIDQVSCHGFADASVLSEPVGGTAPFDFLWADNETSASIGNLDTGTYYLTITDFNGCTEVDSVYIAQPEELSLQINSLGAHAVCGESASLQVAVEGGTPGYAFNWSNGAVEMLNEALGPGTYSVTVTDQNNCSAEDDFAIEQGTDVLVEQEEFLCFGDTFYIGNLPFSSDTTVCLSYLLDNGCDSLHCFILDFYDENSSISEATICFGDSIFWEGDFYFRDTSLSIQYPAWNGCDSILIFNLELYDIPEIEFTVTGSLCTDGQAEIATNPFTSWQWSTGSTGAQLVVNDPGSYGLTVTDDNDCQAADFINIEEATIELMYTVMEPACFGEDNGSIQIESITGGTGPYLTALDGQNFQEVMLYENLAAGDYTVLVEDADGCREAIHFTIVQPDELFIDLEESYFIDLGEQVELDIQTNAFLPAVVWVPGDYLSCDTCLGTVARPLSSTQYQVIVTDLYGCRVSASIHIEVDGSPAYFIPNAFSPNGDGNNDWFTVYSNPAISAVSSLRIYDRWGELLFDAKDISPNDNHSGWDGRFKGKAMPEGVYVYRVALQRADGQIEILSGDLTLFR